MSSEGIVSPKIRHTLFRSFAEKKLFRTFLAPSCIEIFNFVFSRTLYLFDDRMLKEGGSRFKTEKNNFFVSSAKYKNLVLFRLYLLSLNICVWLY